MDAILETVRNFFRRVGAAISRLVARIRSK